MTALIYIYLAGVANNIKALFGVSAAIVAFSTFIYFFITYLNSLDGERISKKFVGWMSVLCFVLFGIASLIPSKDTMYMMAYGYLGEKAGRAVLENEDVREVTSDLLKLVKIKVKEQIVESEKKTK